MWERFAFFLYMVFIDFNKNIWEIPFYNNIAEVPKAIANACSIAICGKKKKKKKSIFQAAYSFE